MKLPKQYDGIPLTDGQLAYEKENGKIMVLSHDHDGELHVMYMRRKHLSAAGATPSVAEIMEYLLWFKLRGEPAPLEKELRELATYLKTSG